MKYFVSKGRLVESNEDCFFQENGHKAVLIVILSPLNKKKYKQEKKSKYEPVHEISNNVVCATSKALDQPAHTRSLIRAFASRLSIL